MTNDHTTIKTSKAGKRAAAVRDNRLVPGPWHVAEIYGRRYAVGPGEALEPDSGLGIAAVCFDKPTAFLIAVSPEMLETLRSLLSVKDHLQGDSAWWDEVAALIKKAGKVPL